MDYAEWEPIYEAIRRDFGFDEGADQRARDRLATHCDPFDDSRLAHLEGATVTVAGAGPTIVEDLESLDPEVVVATTVGAEVLAERGSRCDLLVTDLDTSPETVIAMARGGTPVAVHAHGDNLEAIDRYVPSFPPGSILPTTQVRPRAPVVNVGGFTDGDRAAFLADHYGAAALRFAGWTFDDPSVDETKARKLEWARWLLYRLEQRRGDRFDVLDGQRSSIEQPITV